MSKEQSDPVSASEQTRVALDQSRLELDKNRLALDEWRAKIEHERIGLERYRAENEALKPNREAVVKFSDITIRSLLVLNGGSALALIAFAGNAARLGDVPLTHAFAPIVGAFGAGAGLSVFAAGFSYLAQVAFTEFQNDLGRWWGNAFRLKAIADAIASIGLFFFGVYLAYRAMA